MSVHLDESETTVRLETSFRNITKVLEKGNKIRLGCVWRKVADIAGSLPLRGLRDHHIIALDTMGREVVVAKRSCGSHTH